MIQQIKTQGAQIKDEIDKAQKVLLHLHRYADPDSVGSALAMRLALLSMGKTVTVISGDNPIPSELSFLSGYTEIENKSFELVDLDQHDLFISLDSSSPSQITKNIELQFPLRIPTVVIDHHATNSAYGKINLVVPESPSTAEILFELFEEWKITITKEIATCLYAGIWGDTGGFRWESTGESTFMIAARLAATGVDVGLTAYYLDSNKMKVIRAYAQMLEGSETYYGGKVVVVELTSERAKTDGLEVKEITRAGDMAKLLCSMANDVAIVVFVEDAPDESLVKVSFRSNNLMLTKTYDVSKLAVSLGGGGHVRAAGASMKGETVGEVRGKVLKSIELMFPELTD